MKRRFGTSRNDLREFGSGRRRYMPYMYSEEGVAMLSSVLRSKTAAQVSLQVMRTFVVMYRLIASNAAMFDQIRVIELRQLEYQKTADERFERVLDGSGGYHVGASLKDVGKKGFAVTRIEDPASVAAILARAGRKASARRCFTLCNFRGRLVNDVLLMMLSTSFSKKDALSS